MSEFDEQVVIFQWRDLHVKKYPDLELLEGSMNGVKLPIGLAVKAKKQGMLKGSPDLRLPVIRNHGGEEFVGLSIELKYGKNKPTLEQLHVLGLLQKQRRLAVVCWGAAEAIQTIIDYLGMEQGNV